LDGNGRVVFRYSGRMDEKDMETFFHTLGALLGRDVAPETRP
jgi:hypothetical protein